MDSNQILGLSHFYNPATGRTMVSFAYPESNTADYFILEYYDGQNWVPFDNQNGVVTKDWDPQIADSQFTLGDGIAHGVSVNGVIYRPTAGIVNLPPQASVYYTTGGSINNLTVDTAGSFDMDEDGRVLMIIPHLGNTGSCRIDVNAQGNTLIYKINPIDASYVPLEAGDLIANQPATLVHRVLSDDDFFVYATGGGGGGGSKVYIQDTPPQSADPGSLWWNSDIGTLRVLYNDGDTVQWVETSAIGPSGPKGEDGIDGKNPYDLAVEGGFVDTEQNFNWNLAHVNKLMYDTADQTWVSGLRVTRSTYEDLQAAGQLDPNTLYFVKL